MIDDNTDYPETSIVDNDYPETSDKEYTSELHKQEINAYQSTIENLSTYIEDLDNLKGEINFLKATIQPIIEVEGNIAQKILAQYDRETLPQRDLTFNSFMEKLENSNSHTSKHLKALFNVKGKHKTINQERVFRIARDVIDLINEN